MMSSFSFSSRSFSSEKLLLARKVKQVFAAALRLFTLLDLITVIKSYNICLETGVLM
jgi:hypothetical protein